jgi:putative heme-binding domain-containing protein
MYSTRDLKQLVIVLLTFFVVISCDNDRATDKSANPKISKLKLLPDFTVDHLYSPSEAQNGSWVAMTFDDKGRLIASDQYGALYRVTLTPLGTDSLGSIERLEIGKTQAQIADSTTPRVEMGYAQGLLYAFNSLYVMVNARTTEEFQKSSGLYRLRDTDNDDQFDEITMLKKFDGWGEHGPHSIILSPDGNSIYLISGNHTDLPPMDAYRLPMTWQEDNMFPLIKDPRGHANNRMAPGGWVARIDSLGQHWELISAGYRNAFDIAFNEEGELFTYDADMEWDFGMPWYRPTRICHVTSGSEYGWRTGNSKWSPSWPDNLPPVLNIGQGSPTNLVSGLKSNFPERYKKALFAFDWSFGIIYAIHLKEDGSTYKADAEEFVSGAPLPLTDGAFGPDGAFYFLTGGRRLESDLYRIYYTGQDASKPVTNVSTAATKSRELRQLRRKIEEYHSGPKAGAVDFAWQYLSHEDRFIRYAARIVLEHNPVNEWQAKALAEKDPQAKTLAIIALARSANASSRNSLLSSLLEIDYKALNEQQKIDVLRAFELVMLRMGTPEGALKNRVIAYLNDQYPAESNSLNRSLSKLLVHLDAPDVVEKTLALLKNAKDDPIEETAKSSSDLILRNPQYGMDIAGMLSKVPPQQQTYYANLLAKAKSGWTPERREEYFAWFKNAFGYKGGVSYVGFINKARLMALENVPADQQEKFRKLSGEDMLTNSGNDLISGPQPKGPGRNWSIDEAVAVVENNLKARNFEQGKNMYDAARCSSCHAMRGEGSSIGPDLTQLGTRFSVKDMLEAIIEPNKSVSDQYAATVFTMKDGSSVVGRLTNEDNEKYYVSQNPFAPEQIREVAKSDVVNTKYSYISIMYPGLINRLNEEELKDLMAYLMSGGNPDHETFKNQ